MKKLFLSAFTLICLFVFCVATPCQKQKKLQNGKKAVPEKSKQIPKNSRLVPPPKRTFNHNEKIEFDYDRFKNETNAFLFITLKDDESSKYYKPLSLRLSFSFPGKTLVRHPESIFFSVDREFSFQALDYNERFNNPTDLIALADADRLVIPMTTSRKDHSAYKYWTDSAYTTLSYNDFLILANSKKVEFQLENIELQLTENQLEALRDFASRAIPKSSTPISANNKNNKTTTRKTMTTPNSAAVTTESGLTYIITKEGTGAQLKAGDEIIVNYTGLLTNGQKFDSSLDRGEPFSFPLGAGKVIKGWDEGFQKLRVGDHATLIIPSSIAYGSEGREPVIPPDATLIFIVEVIGVK